MIESNMEFEKQCGEYLEYLYRLAERYYGDCSDIDSLVQDTLAALIVKMDRNELVDYPKGFLSAVLKNKYNAWLRGKYRAEIVEYSDGVSSQTYNDIDEKEENELLSEEYEAVRREIGRLIRIYREVTVRHYVHGQSVEQISQELGIPRGTVLSRLSAARDQIKEGIENMEKYSQISYEPQTGRIGVWGGAGLNGEPFSLLNSDIEINVLSLAYKNPVSVRGIADTMGMPTAYLEPIIDRLVLGELMGRTAGGLVYTRCFVQRYEDSFGDIPAQKRLADKYADNVWEIARKNLEPMISKGSFPDMSDKQKATLILFFINEALGRVVYKCRPDSIYEPKEPPVRKNAGKWLATLTVSDQGQKRNSLYECSGPVHVYYSKNNDSRFDCRLYDFQSVFGDSHWAYGRFKYKFSLRSILRFYASLLPCDVTPEDDLIFELVPEFEELGIVVRGNDGKIRLDIPALPFDEADEYWSTALNGMEKDLTELLAKDLAELWLSTKNRVPKHVDEAEYFIHAGALGAYSRAQLLSIVEKDLLPYPVVVGKTPLIYITYRKKDM